MKSLAKNKRSGRQEKKFRQLMKDCGQHAASAGLRQVKASRMGWARVLARDRGELFKAVAEMVVAYVRNAAKPNLAEGPEKRYSPLEKHGLGPT